MTTVWQSPLSPPVRDSFGPLARDYTRTQDNDHAIDEEFRGRRPSHLEQLTSHSANRNSLPRDVRSTSEGPPIWLIDHRISDCKLHVLY